MIEILTGLPAHTVGFKMSGKLHDEDYKKFVPLVDAEIAKDGKVNVLAQFHDFHGWGRRHLPQIAHRLQLPHVDAVVSK
jgi:hypothetical protein